jgi:uncharacterized protein (DUF302 family)
VETGLVTISSRYSVEGTAARLTEAVHAAGLLLFADIDHAQNASTIGAPLRPTRLLLLGHPRGGTPLMLARQTVGIDLPMRTLIWQDDADDVWLTYEDAHWIASRHELTTADDSTVAAIVAGLEKLTAVATGNDTTE